MGYSAGQRLFFVAACFVLLLPAISALKVAHLSAGTTYTGTNLMGLQVLSATGVLTVAVSVLTDIEDVTTPRVTEKLRDGIHALWVAVAAAAVAFSAREFTATLGTVGGTTDSVPTALSYLAVEASFVAVVLMYAYTFAFVVSPAFVFEVEGTDSDDVATYDLTEQTDTKTTGVGGKK
jgi:hypothetical protein